MDRDGGISKTPGDARISVKPRKMYTQRSHIAGNQDSAIFRGDSQYLRIGRAVRNYA